MSIELKIRKINDVTIVEASGRLTLGEATSELRRIIRELLAAGSTRFLLDMAGVTHMDSAGIGELVATYTAVNNAGGDLKLVHLGRRVHDLLIITKLYTIFETFEDETAALASFSAGEQIELRA
jgi:anti-sigma B factor antagonist